MSKRPKPPSPDDDISGVLDPLDFGWPDDILDLWPPSEEDSEEGEDA